MRHINRGLCTLGHSSRHSMLNGVHPPEILNQYLDRITIKRDSSKVKSYDMWILMTSSLSDTLLFFLCYHLEQYCVVHKVYMLRLLFHPNLNKVWSVDLSIPVQRAKRDVGWCSGHTTQKANSLFVCNTPAAHKQQLQITIRRPYHKEQLHCLLGRPPTNLNSKWERNSNITFL